MLLIMRHGVGQKQGEGLRANPLPLEIVHGAAYMVVVWVVVRQKVILML